jgi:hypothetical protein
MHLRCEVDVGISRLYRPIWPSRGRKRDEYRWAAATDETKVLACKACLQVFLTGIFSLIDLLLSEHNATSSFH